MRVLAAIAVVGSIFSAGTLVWLLFVSEMSPNAVVLNQLRIIANQRRIIHLQKQFYRCPPCPAEAPQ